MSINEAGKIKDLLIRVGDKSGYAFDAFRDDAGNKIRWDAMKLSFELMVSNGELSTIEKLAIKDWLNFLASRYKVQSFIHA